LAHVSDYFIENNRRYLVMQYAPGENLGQLLSGRLSNGQGPFPPNQVLDRADDLLDALDHIYGQDPSVLHLDIKPHNLILDDHGRLMLVDFGLARIKCRETKGYESTAAFTPPFASWEQLANEGWDPRSDLFSLGVTLYLQMVGKMSPDAVQRMSAIQGRDPDPLVPLNEVVSGVSVEVAEVVTRAMALGKEHRSPYSTDACY
jgi:serine/threonine protein kinase